MPGPVIDAGFIEIQAIARRFSVATTFREAEGHLLSPAEKLVVEELCSVCAAGIGVGDAISGNGLAQLLESISQTVAKDKPDAILLGSGGYAGLSNQISRHEQLSTVDGVAAAIRLCRESLAGATKIGQLRHPTRRVRAVDPAAVCNGQS